MKEGWLRIIEFIREQGPSAHILALGHLIEVLSQPRAQIRSWFRDLSVVLWFVLFGFVRVKRFAHGSCDACSSFALHRSIPAVKYLWILDLPSLHSSGFCRFL